MRGAQDARAVAELRERATEKTQNSLAVLLRVVRTGLHVVAGGAPDLDARAVRGGDQSGVFGGDEAIFSIVDEQIRARLNRVRGVHGAHLIDVNAREEARKLGDWPPKDHRGQVHPRLKCMVEYARQCGERAVGDDRAHVWI